MLALFDVEAVRKHRRDAWDADTRAMAAAEQRDYAEAVLDTVREPLLVLGPDRTIRTVNRAFRGTFHVTDEEVAGQPLEEVLDGHFNTPPIRKLLEHVLTDDAVEEFEVEQEFPRIGRRRMLINARRVAGDGPDRAPLILMALADATGTAK